MSILPLVIRQNELNGLQEFDGMAGCDVKFVDDYRLLVVREPAVNSPPTLVLMDTGKFVEGAPIQTVFRFSPYFLNSGSPSLVLERGAHNPSPAESLAPFHQDPSQQIVALVWPVSLPHLILRMGPFLEFLGSNEGSEVGWDEWKAHVVVPSVDPHLGRIVSTWVSGCRFFSLYLKDPGPGYQMEVHDFSTQGRATYRSTQVNENLPGIRHLSSTGVRAQLKQGILLDALSGHGSIVLPEVSVVVPFHSPWQ